MLKVGIVGCGGIAKVHAWGIDKIAEAKLKACADIRIQRAVELAGEYGITKEHCYASLEEMLQQEELDVLHICTPHYLHVPMVLEGLKKGIAVFCEKPPAISKKQWMELEKVCKETKGKLGFCFQNRYTNTMKMAQSIVNSGSLGRITGARAFVTWRRDEDYYLTDWKGKLDTEGGGVLINQSIHTLDLLLRFFEEPTKVRSSIHNHHLEGVIEVEDTVEAWMEFKHGERACFYASNGYTKDAPVLLEYSFEKGNVMLQDQMVLVTDEGGIHMHRCEETEGIGKSCWGTGHLHCIRDFYRSVESGEPFECDMEGVKNTMQVMMRIYGR